MRFKVLFNDEEKEVEVVSQGDRLQVSYGDKTFDASLIHTDGAHFVLEVEEQGPDGFVHRKRIRAAGHRDGDNRQLWANGRLVNYERIREGIGARQDSAADSLSASIPAVVSEIVVSVGDSVVAGDKLILLESMKMIIAIQAPYNGLVQAINCEAGQAVEPGLQLVDIKSKE